ncbi:hypothetical protein [Legionella cincinnatiensis]|uniref:Transmembrane protein n=1 Tax=Legionella cincinnatiensis TaxID=28085 RepID=A0A378ILW7_9GAMM|nr:hypothetical protein [Legionella cincinnatiensis]KTC83406.1 hypothetical protein Lcin_2093 [Legionella cincinnatiensis]STX35491.1 Uncharacterised protein [Legionella cincinnatiensis]
MNIDLGNADAAVGISFSVITDFLRELTRLGRLPDHLEFDRDIGGQLSHITVLLDPLEFAMITQGPDSPRSVLRILGTIEIRPASDPNAPPLTVPLDAAAKLTVILVDSDPVAEIGFRYDGVDGTPSPAEIASDIDNFMNSSEVQDILANTRLPIANSLVEGLNNTRFIVPDTKPEASEWDVEITLTPAGSDSVDAFVVSASPPTTSAALTITESFVAPRTGLAIAYNRNFLDMVLGRGATAKIGQEVDSAKITSLSMSMADNGIQITGHVIRAIDTPVIDVAPDVDIDFNGVAIPVLIRGTTGMTMDTSGIDVDVDDSDEIFYGALRWVITVGASALLFTGVGSLTALGILLWLTLVQKVWNSGVELDNAPNVLRDSLGSGLGAQLSLLADSLDDSTPAGELSVDGTPDSALVVNGNMVLFAQVIITSMMARMRSAEYSHKLRRFVIFELEDRRKFRAQELARLMQNGKIYVSSFHQVNGKYVRSNHDDSSANNLLKVFKSNETREVVVRNQ